MKISQAILATDQMMLDVVKSDVPVLEEASQHIISAGGKRVRPRIMFLTYKAFGGDDLERVVPVAAALELVHTATLVHDDINDHASTRRGRVTINERWGRTFALLTGDYLFTKVYELMAPYEALNVDLAKATVALVEGETLQAHAAKTNNFNQEIYKKIIAKKTASLFEAASVLGAKLAQANTDEVEAMQRYGYYVGMTFQIVDDMLDLVGDPRVTGKGTGLDAAQGKGMAALASAASNTNGHTYGVAVAEPEIVADEEDDPLLGLKRKLYSGGAVEAGRLMASNLAGKARKSLRQLPDSDYRTELNEIVDLVLKRDK